MSNGIYLDLYGVVWGAGADILSRSGAIAAEASKTGKPVDEYHLERLEAEAQRVLFAVADYRAAIRISDDTPVTGPWPRPSYHKQAVGMRCDDVLPCQVILDDPDDAA